MLKKLSVALCVASVFGVGLAHAETQTAPTTLKASGAVTFKGKVTHVAPSVKVVLNGTPSDLDTGLTLELQDVTASQLDKVGFLKSLATPFQVVIKRGAQAGYNHILLASVELTAPGLAGADYVMTSNPGLQDVASNVGVGIWYFGEGDTPATSGNNVFEDGNSTVTITKSFAYGDLDPTFNFMAALQQIDRDDVPGAGRVESTLTIKVKYD